MRLKFLQQLQVIKSSQAIVDMYECFCTQGLVRNDKMKITDNGRFHFAIKPKLRTEDPKLSCTQGFDPTISHES